MITDTDRRPGERRRRTGRAAALMAVAVMAAPALPGCTPIGAAVSVGMTAATAAQMEKGGRAVIDDARIQTEINHLLFQADAELFARVGLSVTNAHVLMTGSVPLPEHRIEAARLAWTASGVRNVINEIQVADTRTLVDQGRDLWITTQLRSRLLIDKEIQSINYDVDTVNAVVYLFGVARDAGELDRVVNHARSLRYVKKVVSHVQMRGDRAG